LGFDAASSCQFGIKNAAELKSYADDIRVIKEWSYVDDPDMRPRIYKLLGILRTQWTVTATIHAGR
jgi:hypothetical protein